MMDGVDHRLGISAWLALFVACSGLIVGCGFDLDSQGAPTEGICSADKDCSGDLVCRSHYCSVASGSVAALDFRFLPPNSSSLQPQTARGISASVGKQLKFKLDSSILVEGRVVYGDSDTGPKGTLVFESKSGSTQRVSVQQNEMYQIWLRPGIYDVSFLPNDPKAVHSRTRLGREFIEGKRRRFDFRLVPEQDLIRVRGRLVHSSQVEGCELPSGQIAPNNALPSASVFAVSEDERFRSTVAQTGEDGRFTVRLPRDTGIYDLYVDAGASPCVIPSVIERGAIDSSRSDISTIQVNLGPVPQNRVELSDIEVAAPDDVELPHPWEKVSVELRAQIGRGTFRTQTKLTGEGRIPASVPPVRFTAHFVPPADSPLAPTTHQIGLTEGLPTDPLPLKRRRDIQGIVRGADGSPVADAQILLKPVEPPAGGEATPVSRRTDSAGSFEMWLDAGAYTGVVRPPATSGQPARPISVGPGQSELSVSLPAPLVANGRVLRSSNGGLKGVSNLTVEARVESGPHEWTLGQTQTSNEGQFSLVLPASLE